MVRPLIKPDAEVDFYTVFCTVVDDFLDGGPRGGWEDRWYFEPAPERFDRADEFGSSERPSPGEGRWFGWECEQFLLHRGTGTAWRLARSQVQEYLRRKRDGEPVEALLVPIEDDPEPVRSWTMDDLRARRRTTVKGVRFCGHSPDRR